MAAEPKCSSQPGAGPSTRAQPHGDGLGLAHRASPGALQATAAHFLALLAFPPIAHLSDTAPLLSQEGFAMLCVHSQFGAYRARSMVRDTGVSTAAAKTHQLHTFSPEHPGHGLTGSSSSCQGRIRPCMIQLWWALPPHQWSQPFKPKQRTVLDPKKSDHKGAEYAPLPPLPEGRLVGMQQHQAAEEHHRFAFFFF